MSVVFLVCNGDLDDQWEHLPVFPPSLDLPRTKVNLLTDESLATTASQKHKIGRIQAWLSSGECPLMEECKYRFLASSLDLSSIVEKILDILDEISCQVIPFWVPSCLNIADFPSRGESLIVLLPDAIEVQATKSVDSIYDIFQ